MIVFDEKIVAVWFVTTITNKQDWMAAVRELEPDQKYELVYRFRYYVDDKQWDSEDKKNWYRGELTGTRNYMLLSLRSVVDHMLLGADGPVWELVNDKGLADFMRRFQDLPFVFARMQGKEK